MAKAMADAIQAGMMGLMAASSDKLQTAKAAQMLSDSVDGYLAGEDVDDKSASIMYEQSRLLDGEYTYDEYLSTIESIHNDSYENTEDAQSWLASVTEETNRWHVDPSEKSDNTKKKAERGAADAFSESQKQIMRDLNSGKIEGEQERSEAYASLVSDNYSDGNETKEYNDGTEVDVSETSLLQKTNLTSMDGSYRTGLDDFGDNAEEGDTKEVCGGTITYKGKGAFGQHVDATDDKGFLQDFLGIGSNDYIALTDEQRGTIVHYEGELGSFDYNTRDFELAYYETEQDGTQISVPCLRYKGCEGVDVLGFGIKNVGITDGECIQIPDGLKNGDYMFEGLSITSMPKLPDSLESAHCMFANCKNMTKASDAAHNDKGELEMPDGMQDISWMFADSGMTEFFKSTSKELMDARCAAAGCADMGHVNEADFTFEMPDMNRSRWLVSSYCDNMFDGCNTEVAAKVKERCDSNQENPGHISDWTDENGAHNCVFDRAEDGSYDPEKMQLIQAQADRREALKMFDPSGKGMTGVQSDTDNMMTSAVHLRDGGNIVDDSTWAVLRQTDKTYTQEGSSSAEFLDKGLAFLGTFGVSSGVLRAVTGSKWVSLIGGLGVAAVPQFVGTANKITPLLDTVSGWLGEDSAVGGFLNKMSDKLKGGAVSEHTSIEELDIDKVFETQKGSSIKYARSQIDALMGQDAVLQSEASSLGFDINCADQMRANGVNLAQNGNLVTMSYVPESDLKHNLNDTLMSTAVDGLEGNLKADHEAGNDISKYGDYYTILMQNMKAYSDGMSGEIDDKYSTDPDLLEQAKNGQSKVMRNTCAPVYESMKAAQEQYGLFSKEQLSMIDELAPDGMLKFSEYLEMPAEYDFVPEGADKYVSEMKEAREALNANLDSAQTAEEKQDAYMDFYEDQYGYLMDEAESHMLVLDSDASEKTTKPEAESESKAGNRKDRGKQAEEATGYDGTEFDSAGASSGPDYD